MKNSPLRAVALLCTLAALPATPAAAAPIFLVQGTYGNSDLTRMLGGISKTDTGVGESATRPEGGTKVFFLRDGLVTFTDADSTLVNQGTNEQPVDVTLFSPTDPRVSFFVGEFSPPFTIGSGMTVATFDTMGTEAVASFDLGAHTATIRATVFLMSNTTGEDLTPFEMAAGGGTLEINFRFVDLDPTTDGIAYFPVPVGSVPVVTFRLLSNSAPVPEPGSFLLMGLGLLGAGGAAAWRRRRA